MSTFESLPADMLARVFLYLREGGRNYPYHYCDEAGLDIPDTAVSRTFRHHARTALYKKAYFSIDSRSQDTQDECEIKTNIGEIIDNVRSDAAHELLLVF
ncbi:hypothetical protein EC988_009465, partial [Linderina pennispora]